MADEKQIALADNVYKTLCTALENREWQYDKDDENLIVQFIVSGDDFPMRVIIVVDADNQLIRLISPIQFKFDTSKRVEGAITTCDATARLIDGCFDYDISDGSVSFRMTASFKESLIGDGLFQYMINCSCAVVDRYNDRFFAVSKGALSLEDFLADK